MWAWARQELSPVQLGVCKDGRVDKGQTQNSHRATRTHATQTGTGKSASQVPSVFGPEQIRSNSRKNGVFIATPHAVHTGKGKGTGTGKYKQANARSSFQTNVTGMGHTLPPMTPKANLKAPAVTLLRSAEAARRVVRVS